MFEFLLFDENRQLLNSFVEECAKVCTGKFPHGSVKLYLRVLCRSRENIYTGGNSSSFSFFVCVLCACSCLYVCSVWTEMDFSENA